MKVVILPDSFKESLDATNVANAIYNGFHSVFPNAEYHLLPLADGGEGTVQALIASNGGEVETINVIGPLNETVRAKIAFSKDNKTAFIEMAEACGLHLVPIEKRDPLQTTSFGVGELILYAIERGVSELIVGVGGSSTNDGGIGMAQALGYQFFDQNGREIKCNGEALLKVASMSDENKSPLLDKVKITIAADVVNPLIGRNGATYIFGTQKGLSVDQLAIVDEAMGNFYQITEHYLNKSVSEIPGSGAGGGMGAGLMLFANASIKKGIELVLEQLNVKEICKDADIVIVGEGRMDGQTIYGKAPVGAASCAPSNAKVIAICGSIGKGIEELYKHGIDAIFPTIPAILPIEDVMKNAFDNIERTARNIAVLIK
ncbi:glycerate kinase [Bacillus sp. AFS055030]|uniref:glycerate kinase n=1 Tax=Bacillus sp. AFS055030 TaxID=2033507 RepID=UPI000BFBC3A3|nr:glycerate kinase [Bacillus sp. AFS055030]PGL67460.1 glycerate kinase [Bacillus sp. AFS055030]